MANSHSPSFGLNLVTKGVKQKCQEPHEDDQEAPGRLCPTHLVPSNIRFRITASCVQVRAVNRREEKGGQGAAYRYLFREALWGWP